MMPGPSVIGQVVVVSLQGAWPPAMLWVACSCQYTRKWRPACPW
jgi:hypothetical protein